VASPTRRRESVVRIEQACHGYLIILVAQVAFCGASARVAMTLIMMTVRDRGSVVRRRVICFACVTIAPSELRTESYGRPRSYDGAIMVTQVTLKTEEDQ
jgi:hypothetical protein